MSIAPVVHTVHVKQSPERAFALFTAQMGRWWPKGKTPGRSHRDIIVEPREGGKWMECSDDGHERQWGCVLAWEPPARLVIGWQLNAQFTYDPALLTEVELTFTEAAEGGTLVRLEHRNLDRFGADADRMAASVRPGWAERLRDFATHADHHAEATSS